MHWGCDHVVADVGKTEMTSDVDSRSETFTIEEISAFDPGTVKTAYGEIMHATGWRPYGNFEDAHSTRCHRFSAAPANRPNPLDL